MKDNQDYIDVLLEHLSDRRVKERPCQYAVRERQERRAAGALWKTLSKKQRKLFLAYEEARNAAASVSEDAYARQAFLLAREIYR